MYTKSITIAQNCPTYTLYYGSISYWLSQEINFQKLLLTFLFENVLHNQIFNKNVPSTMRTYKYICTLVYGYEYKCRILKIIDKKDFASGLTAVNR